LRRECLDGLFIRSERQLRQWVMESVQSFNNARPHQGIAQAIPMPTIVANPTRLEGKMVARPVLHGWHHDDQRRAA
jgi:hypothetical protein